MTVLAKRFTHTAELFIRGNNCEDSTAGKASYALGAPFLHPQCSLPCPIFLHLFLETFSEVSHCSEIKHRHKKLPDHPIKRQ